MLSLTDLCYLNLLSLVAGQGHQVTNLAMDCEQKGHHFQVQLWKAPAQLSVSSALVRVEAVF